ncbi:MAG: glycosyltransferase family 39 protein [Verrucomicrobiaceae bacterium]|nr:glycosyltransferase family 39 protein [Verrucomicrobiaceae bacterium]
MAWLIPERISDAQCRRHGWWVLLALTALLYLPGLGTLPLMDRDEPRFAHATVEMMGRDAWVVPYFNSDPEISDATRIEQMRHGKGAMEVGYRFDKPPLTYWWMRLHYALFGINEFAARLHSVLATWLVALVTFGIASRLAGGRAGLMAGIAWLTTLQVIVHGRLCVADMPMVLFVGLACWALMECLGLMNGKGVADDTSEGGLRTVPGAFSFWHWTLYLSLGLGFLAKGPIALLVPSLALMLWRLAFWRKPVSWSMLKMWPGLLITLSIMGAWGIPALVETQGLYWRVGMQEHVVERGAKAFNGRFPVPGYYLITALLSLFPWIALLPLVWSKVRERWDGRFAFLVSWLAAPYIIFTLYATQLPHYVMPGFPAAMVLLMTCGDLGTARGWRKVWAWTLPVVFWLLAFALTEINARLPETYQFKFEAVALLIRCMAVWGGFVIWPFAVKSRAGGAISRLSFPAWLRQSIAALLIVGMGITISDTASIIRRFHPAARLAEFAGPLPEKTECLGWQFTEPSLVFHFNHMWKFPSKLDTVVARMDRKGPRVIVLLRREWTLSRALKDRWDKKTEISTEQDFSTEVDATIVAHPDYTVISFSGMNAARASWVELRMLVRK